MPTAQSSRPLRWWRLTVVALVSAPLLVLVAVVRYGATVEATHAARSQLIDLEAAAVALRVHETTLLGHDRLEAADLEALQQERRRFIDLGRSVIAAHQGDAMLSRVPQTYMNYADAVDQALVTVAAGHDRRAVRERASARFTDFSGSLLDAERTISAAQVRHIRESQLQAIALAAAAGLGVIGLLFTVFRQVESDHARAIARRTEERYRALTEHSSDIVWALDPSGVIAYASPSTGRVLAHTTDDVTGTALVSLAHADDRPALQRFLSDLGTHPGVSQVVECRFAAPRGEYVDLELVGRNLLDQPDVAFLVLNGRDVTGRNRAADQMRHDMLHDSLTGLPNRLLLVERVQATIAAVGEDRRQSFAIAYIDLDGFKSVNDVFGHTAGDHLLRQVAHRFGSVLRIPHRGGPVREVRGPKRPPAADTLARIGGDEFLVLLNHVDHVGGAIRAAERLQESLKAPFEINGREVRVSASIGVSLGPAQYQLADELIRDADIAMYRAKTSGQTRPQLFDQDMHTDMAQRLVLQSELRAAFEHDEFSLRFQPIVDTQSGLLDGFEALVRWNHPTRGLLPPTAFIEAAEEARLMLFLGRLVLRRTCSQLRDWLDRWADLPSGVMSVNMSALELSQPDAATYLKQVLGDTGVPGRLLKIEITENVAIKDPALAVAFCKDARALGVTVGVDDFGTGYCSLAYLRRFDIDFLKVDRSLVQDADVSSESASILSATVALADALGLTVVFEGVETPSQLAHIRRYPRTLVQGYLLSRPLLEGQAWAWLTAGGNPGTSDATEPPRSGQLANSM